MLPAPHGHHQQKLPGRLPAAAALGARLPFHGAPAARAVPGLPSATPAVPAAAAPALASATKSARAARQSPRWLLARHRARLAAGSGAAVAALPRTPNAALHTENAFVRRPGKIGLTGPVNGEQLSTGTVEVVDRGPNFQAHSSKGSPEEAARWRHPANMWACSRARRRPSQARCTAWRKACSPARSSCRSLQAGLADTCLVPVAALEPMAPSICPHRHSSQPWSERHPLAAPTAPQPPCQLGCTSASWQMQEDRWPAAPKSGRGVPQYGLPAQLLRLQHSQLPGRPAGLQPLVVALMQAHANLPGTTCGRVCELHPLAHLQVPSWPSRQAALAQASDLVTSPPPATAPQPCRIHAAARPAVINDGCRLQC